MLLERTCQSFSPLEKPVGEIERALSPARFGAYLAHAKGDHQLAIRLLWWNCLLCETLYTPAHFAEVTCRNAIDRALNRCIGVQWTSSTGFLRSIPAWMEKEIESAKVRLIKSKKSITHDGIVSNLTFGFWAAFTTSRFNGLWPRGIKHEFPCAPPHSTLADLSAKIRRVRVFRNRVAHHECIIGQDIRMAYSEMLELTAWVSADVAWYVGEISHFEQAFTARPA